MAPRQEANQGDLKNSKYNKLAVKIAAGFAVGATALNLVGCGDTVKATPAPEQTPTAAAPQVPGPEQPTTKETTKAPEANLSIFAEKSPENLKPFNWEDAGKLTIDGVNDRSIKNGDFDGKTSYELNPGLKYLEDYVSKIDGPIPMAFLKEVSSYGTLTEEKTSPMDSVDKLVTARNFANQISILKNKYTMDQVKAAIDKEDMDKALQPVWFVVDMVNGAEGAGDPKTLTPSLAKMNMNEKLDAYSNLLIFVEDYDNREEFAYIEVPGLTSNEGTIREPGSKDEKYARTYNSFIIWHEQGKDYSYVDATTAVNSVVYKVQDGKLVLDRPIQSTVVESSLRRA